MARIWAFYEGPTSPRAWADLPLSEAVDLLRLKSGSKFYLGLALPIFGDVTRDLWFADYKHVVVQILETDGARHPWRPGYWRSSVSPDEAFRRIMRRALVPALGDENLIRVDLAPSTDSRGHDALLITIVIAPGVAERLDGDAVLSARASLKAQLRAMGDDRTPIVQYATKAELAEDVSLQS